MEKMANKKKCSKIPAPILDYRRVRFHNLGSDEFKHLKLLLFWPVFGLLFQYVEKFYPVDYYYPIYCSFDDKIPFCEIFVIPYVFWFLYLLGMHIYTLLYEPALFQRMMIFIIITYTATIIIYFLFPNCQELRPVAFERDNVLTRFMEGYYAFDTNTNVCPSIHVIGSLAVMFAGLHSRKLKGFIWKISFLVTAVLISISTVFLKQHSVLDIFAAIPICILGYFISFSLPVSEKVRAKW